MYILIIIPKTTIKFVMTGMLYDTFLINEEYLMPFFSGIFLRINLFKIFKKLEEA